MAAGLRLSFLLISIICFFCVSAGAKQAKGKDTDTVAVSLSPFIFNYTSFSIFPAREVENDNLAEDRNAELYYPSKLSLEYSLKLSWDNFFATGSIMSLYWTGKYPFEIDMANDSKTKSFNTGFPNYWRYLGLDLSYQFYRSFVHISQDKDTYGLDFADIASDLRYKSFTSNVYLRLFDLYRKNSSLASVMEPLRRENRSWVSAWIPDQGHVYG